MTRRPPHSPHRLAREMLRIVDDRPERWTRGTLAKSARGLAVRPESARARSWCVIGLFRKACDDLDPDFGTIVATYNALTRRVGNVHCWNDAPERTFDDVIELLTEVAESP